MTRRSPGDGTPVPTERTKMMIRGDVAVYVNAPDCSCGHPQNTQQHQKALSR